MITLIIKRRTMDDGRGTNHFSSLVHRPSSFIFYLLLVTCYLLPTICHITSTYAQQPAELGEIVVEAGEEQEVARAPSSFITIIEPAKERREFENLSELISGSAGVTSRSLGGLGQFSTVSIRGSSPEQVTVYLDGIRLNTASGGAFDFSTIPQEAIERIEIVRGGGTAQFGSDAIGGAINIVTKKAKDKRSTEIFGGGGSFTTMKLGASYRESFKKNALTLSWTHLQSEGDFTFKTNPTRLSGAPSGLGGGQTFTRINNGFLSESFLAGWEHRFNKQFKLNILNDFFFTNREVPGTEEETTLASQNNPVEAKERIYRNTNSISIDINPFFLKPLSFSWGVTNRLDIDDFRDPSPALGNAIDKMTYNYSVGSFLKWQAVFDHQFIDQIVTLRYDYRFDYLTDSSPISTATLTGTKTRHINSLFLQDEIALLDDKILFLPSVRYEDASDFPDDIAFKGGLKITPVTWLYAKANIERSFRYPNFSELYFPDQGYIRGNPDLEKERAWNLDAGVGLSTKYGGLEVVYFRNWVDNSILFVPISATTIAPVNTYKVDISGIEISATADPIKFVHAGVSYTYLDAHYASNNNQLPGRPRHELDARLELSYDWNKRFGGTLFGNFNYKHDVPINTDNSVFLAARSRLDLGINLRFAKYYYFTFETKNVTNVQIYDARGFPLPRRSYFLTLGARWS